MPSSGPAEIPTLSLHDALPIFTLGYEGMAVPGIPGRTFTSLREVNTNATGGVTFEGRFTGGDGNAAWAGSPASPTLLARWGSPARSEEHTSELQSRLHLVCRLPAPRRSPLFPYTTLFRSSLSDTKAWRSRAFPGARSRV